MKNKNSCLDYFDSRFSNLINSFNSSSKIRFLIFIFFVLLNFALVSNTVLYRDNARPILIANLNNSFFDLFNSIRYESTTMLYHTILWGISKFIPVTPLVVKVFFFLIHFFIVFTVVYLFKLPNMFSLLVLLQIPQIAYLVYLRQYSISVLLILLFFYFYKKTSYVHTNIFIVLFLLIQSCFHGVVISFYLYLFIVANRFKETRKVFSWTDIIVMSSFILAIPQLIPPTDSYSGLKLLQPVKLQPSLFFFTKLFEDVFLNNYLIVSGFIAITLYIFIKSYSKKKFLTTSIFFTIFCIVITYFFMGVLKYHSLDRHHWLITYLIISFLIYLSSFYDKQFARIQLSYIVLLVFLLIISFLNFTDKIIFYIEPASRGKNVAVFLDKHYPNKKIIAKYEFFIESISVYMKKPIKYFALGRQDYLMYTKANHSSIDFKNLKDMKYEIYYSELIKELENTPKELLDTKPVLILSAFKMINDIGKPLDKVNLMGGYSVEFLKEFTGAKYDNYVLYLIRKNK